MDHHKQDEALSDEELASLVLQGKNSAFSILVKRHLTRFYKVAFSLLRSKEEAEDVVQDCFLKFWKDPFLWREEKNVKFTTWFSKVVTNRSYDILRKVKVENLSPDFDIKDSAKLPDQMAMEEQRNTAFNLAFSKLNKKQQSAIELSFFKNKKNAKAAEIMGMNVKAFQSLLLRSKNLLQANFKKLFEVL